MAGATSMLAVRHHWRACVMAFPHHSPAIGEWQTSWIARATRRILVMRSQSRLASSSLSIHRRLRGFIDQLLERCRTSRWAPVALKCGGGLLVLGVLGLVGSGICDSWIAIRPDRV